MTGFRLLASVTTVATLMTASLVSAAPVHSEAGLLFSKRGSFSGDGTYYNPGLGSCETVSTASQLIAALNAPQFGVYARPRDSPACFSCALVHGPKGSVKVEIVDTCPSCKEGSLDLSPAAFEHIADLAQGRVHITWDYVPCNAEKDSKENKSAATSSTKSFVSASKAAPKSTMRHTATVVAKKPTKQVAPKKLTHKKTTSVTPTPSYQDDSVLRTSTTCNFERRCVNAGHSGEYETCANGKIDQQVCAQGTVCKADGSNIICTWA